MCKPRLNLQTLFSRPHTNTSQYENRKARLPNLELVLSAHRWLSVHSPRAIPIERLNFSAAPSPYTPCLKKVRINLM